MKNNNCNSEQFQEEHNGEVQDLSVSHGCLEMSPIHHQSGEIIPIQNYHRFQQINDESTSYYPNIIPMTDGEGRSRINGPFSGSYLNENLQQNQLLGYSNEQLECLIQVFDKEGNNQKLANLISMIPPNDPRINNESVIQARAEMLFRNRNFKELYNLLENHTFSPKYHKRMQKLWYDAHYMESEHTKTKKLGAVDKYRIRKKFPLPMTIWDGDDEVYCFKTKARDELRKSYSKNRYPQPEEKKKLAEVTGLTLVQGN